MTGAVSVMYPSEYQPRPSTPSTESDSGKSNEEAILEPFTYIMSNPGKDVRGKLIDAFNHWLMVDQHNVDVIKSVIRMLHGASLMVDDIEDDSELRRGLPVAHKIYGVPQTINCANFVAFLAMREVHKMNVPLQPNSTKETVDTIMIDELVNSHRGQGMELLWRETLCCPSEQEYMEMANDKTSGLFRLAVRLMSLASPSTENLVPLANTLGVLFQIRDDYLNLCCEEYNTTKTNTFAEDFTEGKFSFPILHAIRSDPSNRRVLSVLKSRPTSEEVKRTTIEYMESATQSLSYTRALLVNLEKQATEEIHALGGNPKLQAIIEALRVKS